MKRIKFALICTAALMLALPVAGCGRGDSGNAARNGVEQQFETLTEENEGCPDGKCPGNDGECPDGKCPEKSDDDGCKDGKCPLLPVNPRGRRGRIKPLPCPHNG